GKNRGKGRNKLVSLADHLSPTAPLFSTQQRPTANPGSMAPSMGDSNWRTWSELKVKLHDIPSGITTWDLYRVFEEEGGEIESVEIFENTGGRGLTAWVRFIPPPSRAFWESGFIQLPAEGEQSKVVSVNVEAP